METPSVLDGPLAGSATSKIGENASRIRNQEIDYVTQCKKHSGITIKYDSNRFEECPICTLSKLLLDYREGYLDTLRYVVKRLNSITEVIDKQKDVL